MVVDELKLNEEKTEFLLTGTHQQLSKVRTDSLLVAGTVVSSVSEARNLGVWFAGLKITAGCWPVKMTGQTEF